MINLLFLILAVILIAILFVVSKTVEEESFMKLLVLIILVAALAFSVWQSGIFGNIPDQETTTPQSGETPSTPIGSTNVQNCNTKITLKLFDKYTQSSELTNELVDLWIESKNGAGYLAPKKYGRINESATIDVNPGDRVTIVPAVASTTHYGFIDTYTPPSDSCVTYVYNGFLAPRAIPYGNITILVTNKGGATNTNGTPQIINASESIPMRIQLSGIPKMDYGVDKVCVACHYNSSYIVTNDFTIQGSSSVKTANCPPSFDNRPAGKTGFKAFEIPKIESEKDIVLYAIIPSATDQDPRQDNNPSGEMFCNLYDSAPFINTGTGLPQMGYQTDNNADVGVSDSYNISIQLK